MRPNKKPETGFALKDATYSSVMGELGLKRVERGHPLSLASVARSQEWLNKLSS